ncbi:hypothetical protein LS684_03395 [Cytobacillus spongiae]|uniref:hypothetical protein n=1 Tax=Cytobacillus spongiae TaxID=2901381 RepID=UPI001F23E0DB|nr:hypothetical protein [Cytobacillus spongiae]UII56541.1 hypothetical protein LS684_03395 [Cytobacillus spongiae]
MVRNLNESTLAPNVRTIGIAGGTGDGKSEVTSTFADPKAKKILSQSIGETNSTLKERRVVYTDEMNEEMVLAVKLKETIFEREDFNNLISVTVAKIVRDYGKSITVESEKMMEDFITHLRAEVQTKVNSRAVLTFLTEVEIDRLVNEVYDIFFSNDFFSENSFEIYNKVKNDLKNLEVKNNSTKFFAALKSEVEKAIDLMDKEQMWLLLEEINGYLKDIFHQYFSEDSKSLDGYYYHVIDLSNPDKSRELIKAMFSSNNLRKGENLSIEVFCSEIVIYAPIHKKILEIIKTDQKAQTVFMGKDGSISIALYDTKGLYHEDSTDEGNLEYFTELLYSINYDALLLVCPLSGDTNESKLRELYTNAMKKYNKQVPIFILNNKVDLFITDLNKELSSDDPLSLDVSEEELSFDEVKIKVSNKMKSIREELQSVQHKNRKNAEIISLPCYLKKDKSMSMELLKEYNATNSIEIIIKEMAIHLESSSEKISFTLSDIDTSDITPKINYEKVEKALEQLLQLKEIDRKILSPAFQDISDNIGKTPHGNAYNALRRRLRNGYGYTSNIDESYFYNCHSFSVNFTAMVRNLITQDLLNRLIGEAVEYDGGCFKDNEGSNRLKNIILEQDYFNSNDFVTEIVYYKALEEAEKQAFSYGARFNKFLKNSMPYFDKGQLDTNAYTDAIIKTLNSAVKRAIDLHILYV